MSAAQTGALALRAAVARLTQAGVDDPVRDARLLLAHAWGVPADRLTLHLPDPLPPQAATALAAALARRARREPVSHILGRRAFWGRDFIVTPDVLDPRPETETLIEQALRLPFHRVLDLGTGSGAIVVTLLAERPQARGMGLDISAPALSVAARNAQALGVADRVDWVQSDWLTAVNFSGGAAFDLVVSNPPYIDAAEVETLSPEVRDHEPRIALTPGPDGLAPYRLLAVQAPRVMAPGGVLMVEIGHQQGAAVAAIFDGAGFSQVEIVPDLGGKDRVVRAVFPPATSGMRPESGNKP